MQANPEILQLQVYFDPYPNTALEKYVTDYGAFLKERGESPVTVKRVDTVDEVLEQSDVRLTMLLPTSAPLENSSADALNRNIEGGHVDCYACLLSYTSLTDN